MTPLTVITTETPLGEFHLIADNLEVVRAAGFGPVEQLGARLPGGLRGLPLRLTRQHPYATAVRRYFDGEPRALDAIPRTQEGSDFQVHVWEAISSIPPGQTMHYKELAAAAGRPAAVRAAGTVCGQNRLVLLVPCHRVVKSDGGIGNYVYGTDRKIFLLKHESSL